MQTISSLLETRAKAQPRQKLFAILTKTGSWQSITLGEFFNQVVLSTQAMAAAGIQPRQSVIIAIKNSLELEILQHACFRRGVTVWGMGHDESPSFIANMLKQHPVDYIIGCPQFLASYYQIKEPLFKKPKIFDEEVLLGIENDSSSPTEDLSNPMDDAIIVTTSGTTDRSKIYHYNHEQLMLAVNTIHSNVIFKSKGQLISLCWLPLCNPFQKIINFFALKREMLTYILQDTSQLMNVVRSVSPHFLPGIPRLYDKIKSNIELSTAKIPTPIKSKLSEPRVWSIYAPIVFFMRRRIRNLFGSNLEFHISGSAHLRPETADFFRSFGYTMFEAYGLSENIIPMSIGNFASHKVGKIGKILPPNEFRLSSEGEILVKSPGVTKDVARHLDSEGYYPTGDLGQLDADGFLSLHGRISDEFKLSTGRKISPLAYESRLKNLPAIDEAMLIGEGLKFTAALLWINQEQWKKLCEQSGCSEAALESHIIEQVQAEAAYFANYYRPVECLFFHTPLSIESGTLTANYKLRRKAILELYGREIEALYTAHEKKSA